MNHYWIKLYIEILNDPKMGKMPIWLWKRAIELFLLAGENGNDGLLQPVPDIAWRLRITETNLIDSLQALSEIGVVHETLQGWVVTNFKTRQAPSTSTERVRAFRERGSNETKSSKNKKTETAVVERSDSESDSESASVSDSGSFSGSDPVKPVKSDSVKPKAIKIYEENIGKLSPIIKADLALAIAEYTDTWVCDAIHEAVKSNAPNLKYIQAILIRWKKDGRSSKKRDGSTPSPIDYVGGKYAEFIEH